MQIFVLALYAAVYPSLLASVAPERTERIVRRGMEFLGVHGNKIATALCVLVGIHLIIRAAIRS